MRKNRYILAAIVITLINSSFQQHEVYAFEPITTVAGGVAVAGVAAVLFTGLFVFGFIGEKYYHALQLQYAFRDENANAGGWFHVPKKNRTICHKWEHSYPLETLKTINKELGETYDLPKKFRSLIKEWKQGLLQESDSSGFAYMYLSFVQEAYEEENALIKLKHLLEWWFINQWFFDTVGGILHSEEFLPEINYYIKRIKYLRMIIEDSNDYDKEAALYEERVAHGQDLNAYQNMGAQPTITIRKNLPKDLAPIE